MSRAMPAVRLTPPAQEATTAPKASRRRVQEIARVMVLSPRAIGAMESAQQLGHTLRCRLVGTTLVVEVAR